MRGALPGRKTSLAAEEVTTTDTTIDVGRGPMEVTAIRNPADLKPMRPDQNDLANGRILGMPDFGLSEAEIDGLIALLEAWK